MSMFTITPSYENREVIIKANNFSGISKRAIRKAYYHVGKALVKESKRLINLPKTGRIYKIRKGAWLKLRRHVASAPGEAPAKITRSLYNSLSYSTSSSSEMEFGSRKKFSLVKTSYGVGFKARGRVLLDINYPRNLELGHGRVKPRPFLQPAVKAKYKDISNWYITELNKEIKKPV